MSVNYKIKKQLVRAKQRSRKKREDYAFKHLSQDQLKVFNTVKDLAVNYNDFIKFDPKEMNWEKNDIIRVISKKKENKIILKKVNKKYAKQVAYTLTSTGSGSFSFNYGIFVGFKKNRFSGKLINGVSAYAEAIKSKNQLEIEMPKEIFQ